MLPLPGRLENHFYGTTAVTIIISVGFKLVGLRAGSAKNNHYGIGAKVEVRSGSLYQTKVVTEPEIHFGLGPREKLR